MTGLLLIGVPVPSHEPIKDVAGAPLGMLRDGCQGAELYVRVYTTLAMIDGIRPAPLTPRDAMSCQPSNDKPAQRFPWVRDEESTRRHRRGKAASRS
jgi:hypothetical protein